MNAILILGIVAVFFLGGASVVEDYVESWQRFDALFVKYGKLYGVSPAWLKAIALNESSLGDAPSVALGIREPSNIEESVSDDGKSWGLMQLTLSTARQFDPAATAEKLNNPEYSIKLSAQLIAWLSKQFSTVDARWTEWIIKSYNQGVGNTRKERDGASTGYAAEYWNRFQRNLSRVGDLNG